MALKFPAVIRRSCLSLNSTANQAGNPVPQSSAGYFTRLLRGVKRRAGGRGRRTLRVGQRENHGSQASSTALPPRDRSCGKAAGWGI